MLASTRALETIKKTAALYDGLGHLARPIILDCSERTLKKTLLLKTDSGGFFYGQHPIYRRGFEPVVLVEKQSPGFLVRKSKEWPQEARRIFLKSRSVIRHESRSRAVTAADMWDSMAWPVEYAKTKVQGFCAFHNVRYPKGEDIWPQVLKTKAPEWWGRQLKRANVQELEAQQIKAGLVSHYCSDQILVARKVQQKQAQEFLAQMLAVCELPDGERVERDLIELVKGSQSNPEVQRAELMAHIRGTENYATTKKHTAIFYTFTCPSKYHYNSGAKWEEAGCQTPADAQAYLTKTWAKARAKLHREKINMYGFRVAEPHKDGCPHWHCLFWFENNQEAAKASRVLRDYFLKEDATEKGAKLRRVTIKRIDTKKGSATGYIAKYLCKNIDGTYSDNEQDQFFSDERRNLETGEMEETGIRSDEAAARVKAWAACWRIRQFQRIGLPPVGAWRELRRMREEYQGECADMVEALRAAADKGDWQEYLGLNDQHKNAFMQSVRVWSESSSDKLLALKGKNPTDEQILACLNKWQEPLLREVKGVRIAGMKLKTRFLKWVLMLKGLLEKREKAKKERAFVSAFIQKIEKGRSAAGGWFYECGAAPPPWSSVNNCTRGY